MEGEKAVIEGNKAVIEGDKVMIGVPPQGKTLIITCSIIGDKSHPEAPACFRLLSLGSVRVIMYRGFIDEVRIYLILQIL